MGQAAIKSYFRRSRNAALQRANIKRACRKGYLAPRVEGLDEDHLGSMDECPVCLMYFNALNTASCCSSSICTKCCAQLAAVKLAANSCVFCPFCNHEDFSVIFQGRKSALQRETERSERLEVEQAVIQARLNEEAESHIRRKKRLLADPQSLFAHEEGSIAQELASAQAAQDALLAEEELHYHGATVNTETNYDSTLATQLPRGLMQAALGWQPRSSAWPETPARNLRGRPGQVYLNGQILAGQIPAGHTPDITAGYENHAKNASTEMLEADSIECGQASKLNSLRVVPATLLPNLLSSSQCVDCGGSCNRSFTESSTEAVLPTDCASTINFTREEKDRVNDSSNNAPTNTRQSPTVGNSKQDNIHRYGYNGLGCGIRPHSRHYDSQDDGTDGCVQIKETQSQLGCQPVDSRFNISSCQQQTSTADGSLSWDDSTAATSESCRMRSAEDGLATIADTDTDAAAVVVAPAKRADGNENFVHSSSTPTLRTRHQPSPSAAGHCSDCSADMFSRYRHRSEKSRTSSPPHESLPNFDPDQPSSDVLVNKIGPDANGSSERHSTPAAAVVLHPDGSRQLVLLDDGQQDHALVVEQLYRKALAAFISDDGFRLAVDGSPNDAAIVAAIFADDLAYRMQQEWLAQDEADRQSDIVEADRRLTELTRSQDANHLQITYPGSSTMRG